MRSFVFVFFICIVSGEVFARIQLTENDKRINNTKSRYESNLDILTDELLSQSWIENEKPCLEQIIKIIQNVKNSTLWATWFWDSNQLPVGQLYGSRYHLGNYDQCLRTAVNGSRLPLPTQYCLAVLTFQPDKKIFNNKNEIDLYDSTEEYVHSETKFKQDFNVITWGVCTPQICKTESLKKFLNALLKQSHLGFLKSPLEVKIDSCEIPEDAKNQTDSFYIVLIVILLTVIPVLVCTLYISKQRKVNSDSYASKFMECFCLKRNVKDFLGIQKDDIQILHGMRFLSSCVIVLVHSSVLFLMISPGNGLDFEEILNNLADVMLNGVIVVDTFFLMSGLLFIRSIHNGSFKNLGKFVIKRYFRLIWWYVVVLLTVLFVLPRTGCGPLCSKIMVSERGACLKTWWLGLLMLGNYIDKPNLCIPSTWYIFCDFQLTIVGAILFWIYKRQNRTGYLCFITLVILSVLLPGIVTYNSSDTMENTLNFQFYQDTRDANSTRVFMSLYMHTHHRATPYLLGIMMSYIMTKYDPKAFRNSITKKQSLTALFAFFATTAVLLLPSVYVHIYLRTAIFVALHRLIWATMICLLIIVCEYGTFPFVTDILSWPVFVPLSKLTYGIYMVHIITISYNLVSARSPLYFNGYIVMEKFLGNFTLASFISLYVLLFIEAPLNNLVKLFLTKTNTYEDLRKKH